LDEWRKAHPFSDDIKRVNEILWDPYSEESEKISAALLWLQASRPPNQPCLFGRFAAAQKKIHLCVLTDGDLHASDEKIRERIKNERHLWKVGCLRHEVPKEGFLLLIASERVARAAPDENLLNLARHIRDLAWSDVRPDEHGNDITWETLYLKRPSADSYVRFTFSIDYFGSQGDGRWWHDHRIPGGIGFTANSAGYLARSREWYESKGGSQTEFILKVAMETVDESAKTEWGEAIWLEDLKEGRPLRGNNCPFEDASSLKERLRNKDWSVYGGFLSTDHSVRAELFRESPEMPPSMRTKWFQDLTYLYDPLVPDHKKFIEGEPVSEALIFAELGSPDTWRVGPVTRGLRRVGGIARQIVSPWNRTWLGRASSERKVARERIAVSLESMRADWSLEG